MRCRAGKLRFAVGDAQGVFPGEIVDDSIQGACALGQRLLCVDAGRGGPHGEGPAPGVDDLALGGDGAARLRVGVAPGFPGVGETHVVETDACVDVPGRDGVERKSCAEGVSPPGGSVRMYRASSSRGMHPAPPSPGVVPSWIFPP